MKINRVLAMVFLAVFFSASAFASIALDPGVRSASVSRNDLIGLQFELHNFGDEEACIDLGTEQNDSYIETSLVDDFVCLNAFESTNVSLSIRTINAPKGNYVVLLEAESSEGNSNASVVLSVGGEPEIELVAYPSDICRGEDEYINVLVRNNSDEFKEVELQAENEMLLPYFERSTIDLGPFEEEYVKLRIHASSYSSIGTRYVSMYAITDDETVKKVVAIDVENCGEEELANFSVRMTTGCITIEKGKYQKVYFNVKNLLSEEQRVYFSVGGELSTKMQSYSAWLEANQERQFYFEAFADETDSVKDYEIILNVWNEDYSIEKSVCIRPARIHNPLVEVEKNDLEIEECGSAVFTILLENDGDYLEDFTLSLRNDHGKIKAVLSEKTARVERQGSREVYVSVNVLEGAPEGRYTIAFKARTGTKSFEEDLRFTVAGKGQTVELPELEITGYASSVRMDENSSKSLLVSLKNNGNGEIEGISVELLGLPAGITATRPALVSLQPGQEKTVELEIIASEGKAGEYDIALRAYNPDVSEERQVRLIVEQAKQQGQDFFTGFAGLLAAGGLALLGLAILIIVVFALVLIARAVAPKAKEKEIWLRR